MIVTGFINRVHDRLKHADDYKDFKNLLSVYEVAKQIGIHKPQVYLNLTVGDLSKFSWDTVTKRLPNLCVVRPNIFVNNQYDYFLRDDGRRGFYNYTNETQQRYEDVSHAQITNLHQVTGASSLIFEEFPLAYNNTLEYPLHYRVHCFYENIGFIQITSQHSTIWIDIEQNILGETGKLSSTGNSPVPDKTLTEELCTSAKSLSIITELPYARIDFVASTKGPMFRSMACIPGDVRSEEYAWFYDKHDKMCDNLWIQAEERLSKKGNIHANTSSSHASSAESKSVVPPTPDDNA